MARSELEHRARRFADAIQHLLNNTVADRVEVAAVTTGDPGVIGVGPGLSRRHAMTPLVEMTTVDTSHRLLLDVRYQLGMDDEGDHLAVLKSVFGVLVGRDEPDFLFHYDFERNKVGYPEAHLQVLGVHVKAEQAMRVLCRSRKRKQLGDLHFPVGGRRFRPALEDVIQFLVEEELVVPKPGWDKEVERSRQEFAEIQLRAAIRRQPDIAREALADLVH